MNDRVDAAARWFWKHKLLGSCFLAFVVSMPVGIGTIYLVALVGGIPRSDVVGWGSAVGGAVAGLLVPCGYIYLGKRDGWQP